MNDPLAQLSTTATAKPAASTDGKANPLDVLEEILKDAKKPGAAKANDQAQAQIEAQALAEKQAREAAVAAQKAEDETALKAKMAELQQMKQQAADQVSDSDDNQPDDGFQILQLDHTKV